MPDGTSPPTPGWIVLLTGQEIDLSLWERSLERPFDPWCERIPQGGNFVLALRSRSFDQAQSADEVRGHAILLIERLNGALGVEVGAEPMNYQSVGRIDDKGKTDIWSFPGTGHIRIRGAAPIVTVEETDANGNLIPSPPPQESAIQRWIKAGEGDDRIADMLAFAGRPSNWYDIYKVIELAECLSGSEHKLLQLLGDSKAACKNLKATANFYRHARPHRPKVLTELTDAGRLLSFIVRTVLDRRRLGRI